MTTPATPDDADSHTQKGSTRKDLIYVRNRQNGKVYKFACLTCINGHRAPQCDPAKHNGKVLFRRPEPGRPAKNCGHPARSGCDCKAQRNLCCNLDAEQWVELIAGGIPTATMYDDAAQLDAAEKAELAELLRLQAMERTQSQGLEQAPIYPYNAVEQLNTAEEAELAEFLRLQIEEAQASVYPWQQPALPYRPAPVDMQFSPVQMVQHNPYGPYLPLPPPEYYNNGLISTTFEDQGYQALFQPAAFDPQYQGLTMPAETMALQQFAADMSQQQQMAAQPSANPSQSCCSSSRPTQAVQPTVSGFNLPGPSPRFQFPCQSCASYQCTCITCPEVRQGSSGAWSQSCGRAGHIDDNVRYSDDPLDAFCIPMSP